jgi:hypothetical protein
MVAFMRIHCDDAAECGLPNLIAILYCLAPLTQEEPGQDIEIRRNLVGYALTQEEPGQDIEIRMDLI